MRYLKLYFGLVVLLWSCERKSVLIKNSWIVVSGTYKNQPIEFHSTDLIKFTDRSGNEIRTLSFSKDETIILPGINSPNISAKWAIINDRIKFTVDSMRYAIYNTNDVDLSFLESNDSIPKTSERKDTMASKVINPMTTKNFQLAMAIYGQIFNYYISRDTLVLEGQDVKIQAVRDRTIDDLFKKL